MSFFLLNLIQVLKLKNALMNNSILNFTYELEKSKRLNFLDVTVTRGSNGLTTSVYVKPTYDNQTFNYLSIAPLKYKIYTIKALLHRGFHESDARSLILHGSPAQGALSHIQSFKSLVFHFITLVPT